MKQTDGRMDVPRLPEGGARCGPPGSCGQGSAGLEAELGFRPLYTGSLGAVGAQAPEKPPWEDGLTEEKGPRSFRGLDTSGGTRGPRPWGLRCRVGGRTCERPLPV